MPVDYGKLTPAQKRAVREKNRQAAIKERDKRRKAETKRTYQDVIKKGQAHEAKRQGEVAAAKNFQTAPDERKAPPKGYKPINEKALAEASGIPTLVRDAKWAVTHPIDRMTGKGKARGTPITLPDGSTGYLSVGEFSGLTGKPSSAVARALLRKVAPEKAAKQAAKTAAIRPPRPMPKGADVPRRSITLNEKTQQLPAARSRITQHLIEKPVDKASQAMMGTGKVAAVARKIMPTASAEARVAKAAGREQIFESSRNQAKMTQHVKALPRQNSPKDIAHFWYAQLPRSHRNVEGLKLVRGKQADELEKLTTGDSLEGLKQRYAALQARAEATNDLDTVGQAEDLKLLIDDLPKRIEDLSGSIARLDKVIKTNPKYEKRILHAVHALSGDRQTILQAGNVLDPARAAERKGLVSKWLDLEPTGEEAFVGHRLGKVRGSQPSLMPVSVGAGRVKLPQGVSRENKLILSKTGRVRESTHVAAEDWQASNVYRAAVNSRDDLAKMGKPFTGRVPEGYKLVNPKGRAIPPHWKTDKLAKIGQEGFDEEEVLEAAKEIRNTFLADPDEVEAMLAQAKAEGVKWNELRIVPDSVAKRYFGQFTPASGSGKIAKGYDAAVDFTAASIIFARVGYIPKNIAQNLIIAVPHQGPMVMMNVPRAVQILADPELRALARAEVGFSGATQGLSSEARFGKAVKGLPAKAAGFVGAVGDDPLRISALVHELAAAKVIPRFKPFLDQADKDQLVRLFSDPQYRPLLNDVRSRSVEAMADFSRLTPVQRRWARRFLIIPGWLWAGSRYPIHFAATHPIRSAAIGGGVYAGREQLQGREAEGIPEYIKGFETAGGKVMRTTSLSPVSTPWEVATSLAQQSPNTVAGYGNPFAKGIYNVANRSVDGSKGPYRTDFQTSLQRNTERLVPNIDFVRDMVNPPVDDPGLYPEDVTRIGRLKRELGVFPIEINRDTGGGSTSKTKSLRGRSGGGSKSIRGRSKKSKSLRG